jgi:hypothetical protein
MDSSYLILVELVLVLGAVLGWGVWELRSLRRERRRDEEARHAADASSRPGPPS